MSDVLTARPPTARRYLAMLGELRRSMHLRYTCANLVAAPLPPFAAGFVLSRIYRAAGFGGIDRTAFISAPIEITGSTTNVYRNLTIAGGVHVSTKVTLNLDGEIHIGRGTTLSPYVRIYTATHRHGPSAQRCRPEVIARPVVIEEGCWIGLGAMITPGVVVGRGSVVAAGAVVTRSVAPDSLVSGNPGVVTATLSPGSSWYGGG